MFRSLMLFIATGILIVPVGDAEAQLLRRGRIFGGGGFGIFQPTQPNQQTFQSPATNANYGYGQFSMQPAQGQPQQNFVQGMQPQPGANLQTINPTQFQFQQQPFAPTPTQNRGTVRQLQQPVQPIAQSNPIQTSPNPLQPQFNQSSTEYRPQYVQPPIRTAQQHRPQIQQTYVPSPAQMNSQPMGVNQGIISQNGYPYGAMSQGAPMNSPIVSGANNSSSVLNRPALAPPITTTSSPANTSSSVMQVPDASQPGVPAAALNSPLTSPKTSGAVEQRTVPTVKPDDPAPDFDPIIVPPSSDAPTQTDSQSVLEK